MASRPSYGTLVIERESGVVSVRPLRRHRVYISTLNAIAEHIVLASLQAEVEMLERDAAKALSEVQEAVK